MNLIKIAKEFGTEEQCLAYLEQLRWPNGVRCTVCGNDKISRITRKSVTKNLRTKLYTCLETTCKQQFSATSGTIFHKSHISLQKWFIAMSLLVDAKKSLSALQLQQHLGVGSYRTAWYMAHRIRKAMAEGFFKKLTGIVEVDETYIGGKAKRRGGAARNQKPRNQKFDLVMGMRERTQTGKPTARVRYVHIPDGKVDSIRKAIDANIGPGVQRVYTDSAAVYDFAMHPELKKKHRAVNHTREWIIPGTRIHTNTVESAFSLLKRGLIGSFHRVSIKHLHRYLSEFEFRFNERKNTERFAKTLTRMLEGKAFPYRELVSGQTSLTQA